MIEKEEEESGEEGKRVVRVRDSKKRGDGRRRQRPREREVIGIELQKMSQTVRKGGMGGGRSELNFTPAAGLLTSC